MHSCSDTKHGDGDGDGDCGDGDGEYQSCRAAVLSSRGGMHEVVCMVECLLLEDVNSSLAVMGGRMNL